MKPHNEPTTRIFGPVPSRRLGLSLGIDLVPVKTCTYDCLYCQVGRTTRKRTSPAPFVPVREVLRELAERLEEVTPDFVTLSGSGEPTLHSGIGQVIGGVKNATNARIAILTNGSLFWKEEVRKRVSRADLILPTLCTAFDQTFRSIHRPRGNLHLDRIMDGLKRLRMEFKGALFLEVMLLRGFNDSEKELDSLKRAIDEISPDKIQLNTVVRPPADPRALPLDSSRMKEIKTFLGPAAEIVSPLEATEKAEGGKPHGNAVLEMARRRPVRVVDVVRALKGSFAEAESALKDLVLRGALQSGEHLGEMYYYYRSKPEK